jgi:hypothetical protein
MRRRRKLTEAQVDGLLIVACASGIYGCMFGPIVVLVVRHLS